MAIFVYVARGRDGKKVEGSVEAADRRGALAQIEHRGYVPVHVEERGAAAGRVTAKSARFHLHMPQRGMGTREVLLFTTELSDLLASGMTLGNALNCLANRQTGGAADRIIGELRDEIIRGASLSGALSQHPRIFTTLYVNMIKAGEASGAMAEVLKRLTEHYERMQELKEKVFMALVYPAIVIVLGVATLVFSMVYVVPKFQVIFDQMGQALPLPTQILIGVSKFTARFGWAVAILLILAFVAFRRSLRTEAGRFRWDGFLLKMPLIRGIVASGVYATFARTMVTLLGNGVPVVQALGIVENTVGNAVIAKELHNARERVTDGTTISGPLAAGKVFPPAMTDMLSVGEQTGDMPGALSHIARRYENELNRNVKIFTTALEPILIVIVAVLVGFVAISILMAVFNMTNGLNV